MRLAAPVTSATLPARDDCDTNSLSFALRVTSYLIFPTVARHWLGARRKNGYDVSALIKPKREENPMETIGTETITLQVADGTSMTAYVAAPAEGAKAPGLLVFQEIFGVNANIREIAERFAKQGYVAVAPELFHRTAPGFDEAYTNLPACMPHSQALTPDGMVADARAAFDWLQMNPHVLPNAIASLGF
jgi:hypothetical protein